MAERRNFYISGHKGNLDEKVYMDELIKDDLWYVCATTINEAKSRYPGKPIIKYTLTVEVVYDGDL